ncbi:DinB family protein [Hymenobacter sp. B1770]|uniref:DinB family protein n=1 Tax=Hymenobacter sp. B1770 TaxID=1718788 RepID=UPI003CEF68EA
MASSYPRRHFLKTATALTAGLAGTSLTPQIGFGMAPAIAGPNIIGPRAGYSPHVGTLVSMLDWMRAVVLGSVNGMTTEQLDYLHDAKANSIGAMLLHLAATERYYQLHTFEGKKWGSWSDAIKKQWDTPMELGEKARKAIRGHRLDYYLNTLAEVRQKSLLELKKRDDKWLMAVDEAWPWGPTNNYCKWFHVCEHESNHNGQIKFIKSRLPGAKAGQD